MAALVRKRALVLVIAEVSQMLCIDFWFFFWLNNPQQSDKTTLHVLNRRLLPDDDAMRALMLAGTPLCTP